MWYASAHQNFKEVKGMTPLELLNKLYATDGSLQVTILASYYNTFKRLLSNTKSRQNKQLGDLADPRQLSYTITEKDYENGTIVVSISLTNGSAMEILEVKEVENDDSF